MPFDASRVRGLEPAPLVRRLDDAAPFADRRSCKICGGLALPFDSVDFNKYCSVSAYYRFGLSGVQVTYHRCLRCSFTFTTDLDGWSEADFAAAIYNDDYARVDGDYESARPERLAAHLAPALADARGLRMLDYGSGAGVFAQRMRDAGFPRFEEYDPFSHPAPPQGRFDLITCFEVIEHTVDPLESLRRMRLLLAPGGAIIIGQTLQPEDFDEIRCNWWYVAPRNGHVSIFSEEALAIGAATIGLCYQRGGTMFALAPPHPAPALRGVLRRFGPVVGLRRLFAPGLPDDPCPGWQSLEQHGVWRQRWTARRRVSWPVSWQNEQILQLRVPFRGEIRPGFAQGCRMRLGLASAKCRIERGELVAEFRLRHPGAGRASLLTPPLARGGAGDDRALGLAVPACYPDPSAFDG